MEKIDLEKALELVLARVMPINETQGIPLTMSLGQVTGEPIYAPLDNPPFNRSPLDGFTLRSEDTCTASADSPVRLGIAGVVYAGKPWDRVLMPGEAVRIMTGGVIPEGGDCVVPKEEVREDGTTVLLSRPLEHYQNYVFQGEDIRKGQLLIPQGERLCFIHLGILATMGLAVVSVIRPPRIGILCTGSELSSPGKPLVPGKIYNSNEVLLGSRLGELGFTPRILPSMGDTATPVAREIGGHIDDVDLFITTGAVSVGDKDIMREVFDILGVERLFWRMTCKPGGAILCGVYRGKLLMCLSGNPFAGLTTFELLVKPVLAKLTGRTDLWPQRQRGILQNTFSKESGRQRRFVRARLEKGLVTLPQGHSSGHLFSLLGCNCLVDIPLGSGALCTGSEVEVIMLE
ncbi:MAG: molybdopterin molybdotransferase MoeA [Treponema sp.]|jgi:molybdopterin molybdotransferase|nr:molybdopterin molybdotransferase MoeA [Treponema sp.]